MIGLTEPQSPLALALGLGYFALLTGAGLAVGLGLLALLRFPTDPTRCLLLAPFAATMAWALAGTLLVRSGFTMAQVTPPIAAVSLGLAVLGIASAVRMRLRPRLAALVVGVGLVVGLVTWPYFARGLTAHIGSPNLDTFHYTSIAASFWHYGLDPTTASLPFFQRYAPLARGLGPGRNHTFVLLAFLSPLVEPGEPVFVRNLFVCWSLFVLACSLAFYRATWAGPNDGTAASPRGILFYVLTTVGIGWAVVPALVGNWDNGLFVSVGPVLAGLATRVPHGPGYPVLLGASLAYAVYTYPELAPFLGLFLAPLHLPAGHWTPAWRRLLPAYALGTGLAILLVAPGAKPLWTFLQRQGDAARVMEGMRPGGAFAAGLASLPSDLSAWWALGAEHGFRPAESWPRLCAWLLTGLVLAGVVRLGRHGHWREIAAFALMATSLVYFVFVDRYGYAAYKILSVGWWLVGRCVVEGFAGVVTLTHARSRVTWPVRLGHRATIGALAAGLLTCLVVAERHRFQTYFPRDFLQYQPTLASLARLRSAAASQPPIDAVATQALGHPFMLPWVFYALRDTPVRLHHDKKLTYPVPGGAPWPDGPLPAGVLLPARDLHGGLPRFTTAEFALVDFGATALIESIENPNQLEAWGTWLGTRAVSVTLLAGPGLTSTLSFDAAPGPSLPETPRRTLLLHAGSRELGRVEIDGPGRVAFQFVTAGGREVLTLSTPDLPSVTILANGDPRPLLVSVRNLTIGPRGPER